MQPGGTYHTAPTVGGAPFPVYPYGPNPPIAPQQQAYYQQMWMQQQMMQGQQQLPYPNAYLSSSPNSGRPKRVGRTLSGSNLNLRRQRSQRKVTWSPKTAAALGITDADAIGNGNGNSNSEPQAPANANGVAPNGGLTPDPCCFSAVEEQAPRAEGDGSGAANGSGSEVSESDEVDDHGEADDGVDEEKLKRKGLLSRARSLKDLLKPSTGRKANEASAAEESPKSARKGAGASDPPNAVQQPPQTQKANATSAAPPTAGTTARQRYGGGGSSSSNGHPPGAAAPLYSTSPSKPPRQPPTHQLHPGAGGPSNARRLGQLQQQQQWQLSMQQQQPYASLGFPSLSSAETVSAAAASYPPGARKDESDSISDGETVSLGTKVKRHWEEGKQKFRGSATRRQVTQKEEPAEADDAAGGSKAPPSLSKPTKQQQQMLNGQHLYKQFMLKQQQQQQQQQLGERPSSRGSQSPSEASELSFGSLTDLLEGGKADAKSMAPSMSSAATYTTALRLPDITPAPNSAALRRSMESSGSGFFGTTCVPPQHSSTSRSKKDYNMDSLMDLIFSPDKQHEAQQRLKDQQALQGYLDGGWNDGADVLFGGIPTNALSRSMDSESIAMERTAQSRRSGKGGGGGHEQDDTVKGSLSNGVGEGSQTLPRVDSLPPRGNSPTPNAYSDDDDEEDAPGRSTASGKFTFADSPNPSDFFFASEVSWIDNLPGGASASKPSQRKGVVQRKSSASDVVSSTAAEGRAKKDSTAAPLPTFPPRSAPTYADDGELFLSGTNDTSLLREMAGEQAGPRGNGDKRVSPQTLAGRIASRLSSSALKKLSHEASLSATSADQAKKQLEGTAEPKPTLALFAKLLPTGTAAKAPADAGNHTNAPTAAESRADPPQPSLDPSRSSSADVWQRWKTKEKGGSAAAAGAEKTEGDYARRRRGRVS